MNSLLVTSVVLVYYQCSAFCFFHFNTARDYGGLYLARISENKTKFLTFLIVNESNLRFYSFKLHFEGSHSTHPHIKPFKQSCGKVKPDV